MAKPNSKRKTRSDKFLLTLHPTGQYCKKIRGKLYYFGNNKQQAVCPRIMYHTRLESYPPVLSCIAGAAP